MTRLALALLGPLHITLGTESITAFRSDKEQALLAYLVLEGDRPHRREALAGLLWGDLPEESALNNLRKVLHHLRQVLGEEESAVPFLVVTAKTIQLNKASLVTADVFDFEQAWSLAQAHSHRRAETCQPCRQWLEAAARQYRGDLLQGFNLPDAIAFDEWLLVRREQLRQQALSVFQRLTDSYDRQGDLDKAAQTARQQVSLEPWREVAHRQLMGVLARSGQRAAALAQYEICRRSLQDELGVQPEAATQALYEKIKRGADLEMPRTRGLNLPIQPTPFFGREQELAKLDARLRDPAERLLTILAVGGMGKTRLALKAATTVADDYSDGVWFVSLAGAGALVEAEDAEAALVRALAASLRIALASGSDPKTQVLSFLQPRECLLILDNFEHLLEASGLILDILREAPSVTMLVTSRERLNLQAERVIFLDGLALPPGSDFGAASGYSAVQLFLERAERSAGPLTLTDEIGGEVVAVCRMLDGLPLGIELAAATVRVMSPMQLAQTIRANIEVLATTMRDLPPRHRSLKAVFDQSWGLLNTRERQVLAQVSVFVGGFTAQAAQAVADAEPAELTTLVEKSLLRQSATGRFEMHEMWRQLAGDKLVVLGRAATSRRHARFYLQYVASREAALLGPEPQVPLAGLRLEIDNIREGWRVLVDELDGDSLTMALDGLSLFYDYEGLFNEGAHEMGLAVERLQEEPTAQPALVQLQVGWAFFLRRLDRHTAAIELLRSSANWAQQAGNQALEANARLQWGMALWQHSDYDDAKVQLDNARQLAQLANLPNVQARALRALGAVVDLLGQYSRARAYFELALEIFVSTGNHQGECETLHSLGNAAWSQGDLVLSKTYHERCLRISRAIGNRLDECDALHNLGNAAQTLGDYETAEEFFNQSIRVTREAGLPESALSLTFSNLGLVMRHLGRLEIALDYGQQSLTLAREAGLRREEALALVCLAHNFLDLRQVTEAQAAYQQAFDLHITLQQINQSMESLAGLARCALAQGDKARALTLVETILTHLQQGNLEGIDEPFGVYLTCYKTLKLNNDARAQPILRDTRLRLLALADRIDPPETRLQFLEANEIHREVLSLSAENLPA